MKQRNSPWVSILAITFLTVAISSCKERQAASQDLYLAVDELFEEVLAGTDDYKVIAEIDHSRLAAKEGGVMPPARVVIFSDPELNSQILQQVPRAGLDLPFRVLAYAEGDMPAVIYTPADYLKRRHGLSDGPGLQRFGKDLLNVVSSVPQQAVVEFNTSSLEEGAGIKTLNSEYAFDQTVERLKSAIMAEGDTIWFGEIDYQAEAEAIGIELPKLTLLLFGAPGPGAKAMADIPRMGLDAFCQKALVHELADGKVEVYYNEMPVFAELHQGSKSLPHRVINYRMGKTLSGAVNR